MAFSAYIDSFRFSVAGRIAANGPVVRLKNADTQKEAESFILQHVAKFPFSSPFIVKPEQKAVVGKTFWNKRKDAWHKGGTA